MDKIGAARGLIRYTTENALTNKLSVAEIRKRALRPRVLIYGAILSMIVIVFVTALTMRTPLKLDVIRDRGAMGREVEDGMIENVYRLQIMNTTEQAHQYRISVDGIETLALVTPDVVRLDGTETRAIPVRVRAAAGHGAPGSNDIHFKLQALDDASLHVSEHAVFFVPR